MSDDFTHDIDDADKRAALIDALLTVGSFAGRALIAAVAVAVVLTVFAYAIWREWMVVAFLMGGGA